MNLLGETMGHICKLLLPISEEYYVGDPKSTIAVCTLASIDLLRRFKDSDIIDRVHVAGRLLSENKGIDRILNFVYDTPQIQTLVVCGSEVWGHRAGHSLFALYHNGVDTNNRIIGSCSPDPYLTVLHSHVAYFQTRIHLINMIHETNFELICDKIKNL